MNYSHIQRSMPLLGNVKREREVLPERLEYLLDDITTPAQAILFSIHRAGRNQTVVGEEMGLKKSHWSGIVNGTKNMSWSLKERFMDFVGNDILLQWFARKRSWRLVRMEPTESEKLKARIEQLEHENEGLKKARG